MTYESVVDESFITLKLKLLLSCISTSEMRLILNP